MSRPLRYELEGLRSARRGDCRVLFALDHDTRVLLVGADLPPGRRPPLNAPV
ncbi:hypothetical protein [Cellulomonas sp.]|uniref:type II toxin-antitoxin system RelE family toxin n=1 Tax=Cellulomonas sp. TaxID=40001 RepID=UPI002582F26D|nr:hypothetical protein [Cellulomonas sp.]